jgi:hypothetical protein
MVLTGILKGPCSLGCLDWLTWQSAWTTLFFSGRIGLESGLRAALFQKNAYENGEENVMHKRYGKSSEASLFAFKFGKKKEKKKEEKEEKIKKLKITVSSRKQ